jgi:hypothetical protein
MEGTGGSWLSFFFEKNTKKIVSRFIGKEEEYL